jgi:formylglycine-generating enzyme required for sulfatase activity
MGRVYLAHDRTLDREVAVKFLAVPPSDAALARFLVEARATARLQHPNVVTVHRIGALDGRPYIVTELLRGEPLDRVARPLPWREVLEVGVDLASGLAAAHRAGILHRDLKPANAIRRDDGGVVLLDFGLAKLAGTAGGDDELDVMGTPLYMAPEIFEGAPASVRSDLYSLGVLLFELCAGEPPHRADGFDELVRAKLGADARSLAAVVADVDARFARIVERCLALEPDQRFASADELREALESLGAERSVAPVAGNPYRGLLPFGPEHRALFFGRGRDTRAVIDRLRGERFVLVVGESGVGKSSLCRAAVAPAIEEGALDDGRRWASVVITPGRRPAAALAAALGAEAAQVLEQPQTVVRDLQRRLGGERGLLVIVDQLEELVTLADPDEARAAAEVIAAIVANDVDVRVLATARGDLLAQLTGAATLGPLIGRALEPLLPLDAAGVRASIEGPARAAGVSFADDAIVDELVAAAGRSQAGLPLLQFALAELWERRDERGVITREALAELGGVEGALARHADRVLAAMLPDERSDARRVLVRLATAQGTRARRTVAELGGRAAIDRLVASRLLVAREHDGEPTVEVAHEALFTAWGRLRDWIDEEGGVARLRERVAAAAQDWEREGRPREALWGPRALLAADAVPDAELDAPSRAFLAAGRRARWLRRVLAAVLVVVAVGAASGAWALSRWQARSVVAATVRDRLRDAGGKVDQARALRDRLAGMRAQAYAAFDAREVEDGEARWAEALALTPDVVTAYGEASSTLEAALRLAPGRGDVRRFLLDVLYERAVLAEADRQDVVRDELLARIAVYDDDGVVRARWRAPALVRVNAGGATLTIDGVARPPGVAVELAPGTHLVEATAPGAAHVRVPIFVERGRALELSLALPPARAVPDGFVYVPPGELRFGSAGDEGRRTFFGTAPEHVRHTGAFLIARHETTYADWIAFLDELPPDERERRRPRVGASGFRGRSELERDGDAWVFVFQPSPDHTYRVRAGERFRYLDRDRNADQDWRRFPVAGISWEDAGAYVGWLRERGRVPGARLCREDEWSRATRGADGRLFPSGATLADANIDTTYGRRSRAYGPDEVGLHPASDSPFGLADTAGNVFEMTVSVLDGEVVARGGAYYFGALTAAAPNRQVIEPTLRDPSMGLRVCADPQGTSTIE